MSSSYLHDGILLYLNRLTDWQAYYSLTKGDDVDVDAEKEALETVLETAAAICAGFEAPSRETWDEAASLKDGNVALPDATQNAYDQLREAGLVSLNVRGRVRRIRVAGIREHDGHSVDLCVSGAIAYRERVRSRIARSETGVYRMRDRAFRVDVALPALSSSDPRCRIGTSGLGRRRGPRARRPSRRARFMAQGTLVAPSWIAAIRVGLETSGGAESRGRGGGTRGDRPEWVTRTLRARIAQTDRARNAYQGHRGWGSWGGVLLVEVQIRGGVSPDGREAAAAWPDEGFDTLFDGALSGCLLGAFWLGFWSRADRLDLRP